MSGIVVRNEQLFQLERVLNRYVQVKNVKLGWCLSRNASIINPIIKDVRNLLKPTDAMQKRDVAIAKLENKYGERDKKDNVIRKPVIGEPGTFEIEPVDVGAYQQALSELKENHASAYEDTEAIEEKTPELLEEENEVKFYKLPLSKVPDDVIIVD